MLSLNEQARYMYEQGMSLKEIGQELRFRTKHKKPIAELKLRPKEELYIALEGLDFTWYSSQVETVRQMWGAGEHIADIAEKVRRHIDEVALLIMDLKRRDKIKNRPSGVFKG